MPSEESTPTPIHEPRFYSSRIFIPEDIQIQLVELLNQNLSSSIDLNSQIRQTAWYIRGMSFYQFYGLLTMMSQEIGDYIEALADRIGALSSTPLLTVRTASAYSQLTEFPFNASSPESLLIALSENLARHGGFVREAIAQASDLDDTVTADLYTSYSSTLDHHLWLIESHYQKR